MEWMGVGFGIDAGPDMGLAGRKSSVPPLLQHMHTQKP
jgi:hypothetical protein